MYGKAIYFGGRSSWRAAPDCKSGPFGWVGSNPTPPTRAKCSQLNMRILSLRNYIGVSVFKPKSSLRRLREGCRVVLKALDSIWIKWDSPVCLWVEMIYTTAVLTPIRHLIWRSICVNMVSFISWTSRILDRFPRNQLIGNVVGQIRIK